MHDCRRETRHQVTATDCMGSLRELTLHYPYHAIRAIRRLCIQERPTQTDRLRAQTQSFQYVCTPADPAIDIDFHLLCKVRAVAMDLLEDFDRCSSAITRQRESQHDHSDFYAYRDSPVELTALVVSTRQRVSELARGRQKLASGLHHGSIAQYHPPHAHVP